jgi:hypothetical protein
MEDIEDLFNEDFKETESPLVIPEFGPCSGDGTTQEEEKKGASTQGCCKNGDKKSLTSSQLKPCDCIEETKSP